VRRVVVVVAGGLVVVGLAGAVVAGGVVAGTVVGGVAAADVAGCGAVALLVVPRMTTGWREVVAVVAGAVDAMVGTGSSETEERPVVVVVGGGATRFGPPPQATVRPSAKAPSPERQRR
jgi:hypothetical protein